VFSLDIAFINPRHGDVRESREEEEEERRATREGVPA
jgi:hypothetical protein